MVFVMNLRSLPVYRAFVVRPMRIIEMYLLKHNFAQPSTSYYIHSTGTSSRPSSLLSCDVAGAKAELAITAVISLRHVVFELCVSALIVIHDTLHAHNNRSASRRERRRIVSPAAPPSFSLLLHKNDSTRERPTQQAIAEETTGKYKKDSTFR